MVTMGSWFKLSVDFCWEIRSNHSCPKPFLYNLTTYHYLLIDYMSSLKLASNSLQLLSNFEAEDYPF